MKQGSVNKSSRFQMTGQGLVGGLCGENQDQKTYIQVSDATM